jgi:hypothetical protein
VVFDEASPWWSSQAVLLPDSKEIEEQVQKQTEVQQQDVERAVDVESSRDQVRERSSEKERSPWQTGVHTRVTEDDRPSQIEEFEEEVPQLQPRRSTRPRKPNPEYANVALVVDNGKKNAIREKSEAPRHRDEECQYRRPSCRYIYKGT